MRTPVPNGRPQAAVSYPTTRSGKALVRPTLPPRAFVWAALVALILAAGAYEALGGARGVAVSHERAGPSHAVALTGLPIAAQGAVSATLGAHAPAYRVARSRAGFTATSPAQHLHASFSRAGVTVSSGALKEALSLRAVGYGRSLAAVGAVHGSARANRVQYASGGVLEWYANGPLGIEQGFTLAHAPAGDASRPLTLSIALAGDATVAIASDRRSATISRPGASPLRYGGLLATDAHGRALDSWMELHGGRLLVRVSAQHAAYPLRIDPLFQQAQLEGKDEVGGGHFGRSVALSADGNTALVGGPLDEEDLGAAWIFTRTGSSWSQQAELGGASEEGDPLFGRSVALSGDGNTALVGDPGGHGEAGVAWVYTRTGSTWTRAAKLEGEHEIGAGQFGGHVALSADGSTALIAGVVDDFGAGAAWVFSRSGESWTQQAKLTGGGGLDKSRFGRGVALSAEGSTALVGASSEDEKAGAAWLYTRAGSSWGLPTELPLAGESGAAEVGRSVALSGEGATAIVGGPRNNAGQGAAWVFTLTGSTWTQAAELHGGGEAGEAEFGSSVALSSDASTALVGGPEDNRGVGAAWLFSAPQWQQQGAKLIVSGEVGEGAFGSSTALSANGGTAVIGGISSEHDAGAAWVFATPAPTVTAVEPDEGPQAGETPVVITGTGFTASSKVSFGEVPATGVSFESPTRIKAVSPPGSGSVDVTVTGIGGTSATNGEDVFSYEQLPTVTHVAPGEGPVEGGTSVVISGSHFKAPASVSFGGVEATDVVVETPTRITALAPGGTGTVSVTVTSHAGTSAISPTGQFTYDEAPTVTGLTPVEGPAAGETPVVITGSGFTANSTVSFGGVKSTSFTVQPPSRITAVSPAGTGTVEVTVTSAGGTSAPSPADLFTYESPPTTGTTTGITTTLITTGGSGGTSPPPAGSGTPELGISPFIASTPPTPTLGLTGTIAPVSGTVLIRLPGSSKFVPLTSLRSIPFHTVINATAGRVAITTVAANGVTQVGEFFEGTFVLSQRHNGLVVASLTGGNFAVCPTAAERGHIARAHAASSGKHSVRKLWADAHGSYSTKGNYAAGAVQGTEWLTEDRCEGTLIKVARDKVKVTDLINHHVTFVTTGHSRLTKAP